MLIMSKNYSIKVSNYLMQIKQLKKRLTIINMHKKSIWFKYSITGWKILLY